jgi:hypothetical protein
VNYPQGVEVDEYGFTIIDLRNVGHKDDDSRMSPDLPRGTGKLIGGDRC